MDERSGGYVAVYRTLLDHPLMNQLRAAWFRIFIAILLKANWKAGVWWDGTHNVTIPPGSFITSLEKLSKITDCSVKQVRNCLAYLSRAQIATIQRAHRYTHITILNWDTYQNREDMKGTADSGAEGTMKAQSGHNEGTTRATVKSGNHSIRESCPASGVSA